MDHPATETGASSEPYQTTHGRYNMGPTDQNTGKSHRQQQHSHNTDVIFGPFTLHSTPILTRLPTISRPFADHASRPHADHSGAVQRGTARPPKHGPLTGGTTWDHRVKSHRQHQHTCQHIVGLMSFRRRSKVRGRGGGGGGGGGGGKAEPY